MQRMSDLPAKNSLPRAAGVMRRTLRWMALVLALVLLLPVMALVTISWLEISISAGPWRDRIARAASDALGRPVALEGPLELVPSLRPILKVGGIRIANPPGFATPELAYLGEARLRVDLRALLRKRVHIMQLSAENVRAYIERSADGTRVNYAFEREGRSEPQPPAAGKGPDLSQVADVGIDIRDVSLRQLSVEYLYGPSGSKHYFQLDELTAAAPRGESMHVAMRGSVEKRFPYSVAFTGGRSDVLLLGQQPWPFEVVVDFLGGTLRLDGTLARPGGTPVVELLFGLGAEDLSQLERLLQIDLPEVGTTGMAGRLRYDGRSASLSGLRAVMGRTTLEADLAYDFSGARPRVSGQISLPALDLRPFLGIKAEDTQKEPANLLETYRELERQAFSLRALQSMDADVTLSVGRWLSLPGDVRDAQLRVELNEGVLRAPIQATIAQVPLKGEARVDGAAEVPSFVLELGAQRTRLGGLAALLAGIQGMQGDLGRFLFRVAGRGETLGALTRTVDVRLAIDDSELTYGNVEGGRPVELRLDTLDVRLPGGKPLTGKLRGALLGEPFEARLSASDLPTLARTLRSPLSISARATGARLQVDGTLAMPEADSGTDIAFRLSAPRAGDVGRWLGLSPTAQAAARLEGRVRMQRDEWRLSGFILRLGRTAMTGELARVGIGRQPLIQARLDVEQIDVQELESMSAPRQPEVAPSVPVDAGKAGSTLDIPILPQGIDLTDADVEVRVRQAGTAPAEVRDAVFTGRIRDGHMAPSPFSARVAGVPFSGAVALDLRGQLPQASLWIAAGPVDVGRLLRDLNVAQGVDAQVEAMRVQLIGRGSRLGEMLEKSALDAELDSGALTLRDPTGKPLISLAVKKGAVVAAAGKPVTLSIDGAIDRTPIAIRVSTGAVRDFMRSGSRMPFALEASAAGARLDLAGKVSVPIAQREGELELRIAGERFDTLNELARVQLPPWGPWSLGGRFVASAAGYEVPDLRLQVGESRLNGRGTFTTAGVRPRVDVKLDAPRIQLDDFEFGTWSPVDKSAKAEEGRSVDEMRAKAKEAAAEGQRLLSPQTLRRLDAYLDVRVDEVLSGADRLGSGTLHAQLADGRLEFGPALVNVPGGSALLSVAYQPSDQDVAMQARVRVERFDYGILARRAKPGTDFEGLFSLRFDLDARAPTIDALMSRANGRIDFAVWPRNMRSGIFDLWAVNVFVALVPAVDPSAESKVNCAFGRFDLRDGKLTHDAILIDTSRMRVAGEGRVDFDTETMLFRLAPRAKTAQFFSLATPIAVSGKLTDFEIGVAPGGVAETTVRFLTSLFVVPVQKLAQGRVPRDGADVCTNPMRDVPAQ
jgi:AsmA family protein